MGATIFMVLIVLVLIGVTFFLWKAVQKGKPEVPSEPILDSYNRNTGRVTKAIPGTPDTYPLRKWFWIPLVAIVLVILSFSFTTVPANSWDVRTSLGKPTGEVLGSGPHLVLPWTTGTEFSSARQFVRFKDKPGENEIDRIHVRLAGQASADLTGVISYSQPRRSINDLFLSWKTEERIRGLFAETLAKQSLNEALGVYDPLAADKQKADANAYFSAEATKALKEKFVGVMDDVSIAITDIDYDPQTDLKLSELQSAVAQTRIATQAALTAEQIATANKTIAASISGDPVVAFYQCSAMWSKVIAELKALPASLDISAICASTVGVVR